MPARPVNAGRLRNFEQYEKDKAFIRRYENAVNRLVEQKIGDRDVLWQLRAAINRTGTPDESYLPRQRRYRGNFRSREGYPAAAVYALLQGIVWSWWLHNYTGKDIPHTARSRRRFRKRADAGVIRLWAAVKNGYDMAGDVRHGYWIRPRKVSE